MRHEAGVRRRYLAAIALVLTAALLPGACTRGEEAAIRGRLKALVAEANRPPADGLALMAHAVGIGGYFSEDVAVDLGPGAPPIHGREMLIGMVSRLQPQAASYRVEIDDVAVRVADDGATAGVAATVSRFPRDRSAGEGTDAREFAATMSKADGTWRITRLTAVQTLR